MENVIEAIVLQETVLLLSDNACTATPDRMSLIEHGGRYRSERLQETMLLLNDSACTATPDRISLIEHGGRYRSDRFAGDTASIKRQCMHGLPRQRIPD
jgi:hypothetical protein